jgi:hypothetical protein
LRRDIARIQDPYIREAWTLADRIKVNSGVPGYSEGAPPRRDFFGQPIRYRGGSFLGVLSPFPDSQEKREPVVNEIARVMQETRQVPITMPGRRIEGMLLSAKQYDALVRIARSEDIFEGATFKDQLRDVMNSAIYQDATDDYKVVLLKQIQSEADKIGRALLEQRDPVLAERLTSWRLTKARRLYGELPREE